MELIFSYFTKVKTQSSDEQGEYTEGYTAQKEKRHKASNDRHKIRMVNNRYEAQTYWVAEMELPKGKLLTKLEYLLAQLFNNYFDKIHLPEGGQLLLRNI